VLLRDADTAMYEAERRGRARLVFFSSDMHARVAQALATGLRLALADGAVEGVEVLAHWEHPQRGRCRRRNSSGRRR
jgi:predicted signal transduction protein with EAL and GGDEF domain